MHRGPALLAVGLLTSCASTSTANLSPIPTPAPSAAATIAARATPSPAPAAPACRLPYLLTNGRNPVAAVGFLKLPDDKFQSDPGALSNLPPSGVQAVPSPGLNPPSWDAPAARWVPVPLTSVSSDGSAYAYMSADGVHHVVVATGADSIVYKQPQGVVGGEVMAYQPDGIYLFFPSGIKDGAGGVIANPANQVGLWRIDVASGAGTKLHGSDNVGTMAAGALWIIPATGSTVGDSLFRVDLASGQQSLWFTDPGRMMQFLGVDMIGMPIVWTFAGGHLEIWHVTAPNQATNIYALDYTGNADIFGPEMQQGLLIADRHGVWFGAADGLFLYDSGGFRKVASTSGIPAGPCQ